MTFNLFNKNKKQSSSVPTLQGTMFHRLGRDHYFDWGIMFVTTIIVIVLLVTWGGYVYINIESRLISASTLNTAKKPETVNEKVLSSIIDRYNVRAAERSILLKGYGGFGDPAK